MKKLAILFAAISMMYFAGCSDDNDSASANGETCTKADDCKSGYCNADQKCADKPADKKANDETCTKAEECESGYCNADQKCADKPADKKANDETCTKAEECESGYCNADKKCADKPAAQGNKENGEECAHPTECKSNYCSDDNVCADKPAEKKENGQSCAKAEECKSGVCKDKVCVAKDPAKDGDPCKEDKDCTSKFCDGENKCAELKEGAKCHFKESDDSNANLIQCHDRDFYECYMAKDSDAFGTVRISKCLTDGACYTADNFSACLGPDDFDNAAKICKKEGVNNQCIEGKENPDGTAENARVISETCVKLSNGKLYPDQTVISAIPPCPTMFCNEAGDACGDKPASKKANDETCTKNEECESGYCNADQKCADKPAAQGNKANGEKCAHPTECKSNYCSNDNVCADKPAEKKANGQSCAKAEECKSGVCKDKVCVAKDPVKDGDPCEEDKDCTSKFCDGENKCAELKEGAKCHFKESDDIYANLIQCHDKDFYECYKAKDSAFGTVKISKCLADGACYTADNFSACLDSDDFDNAANICKKEGVNIACYDGKENDEGYKENAQVQNVTCVKLSNGMLYPDQTVISAIPPCPTMFCNEAGDGCQVSNGSACKAHQDCAEGFCKNEVCTVRLAVNKDCNHDDEGRSRYCNPENKCELKAENTSCFANEECKSNKCGFLNGSKVCLKN